MTKCLTAIILSVFVFLFCISCESDPKTSATPSVDPGEIRAPAALVVTTDYQTGAYAVVRLSDRAVARNVDLIHQDSICRFDAVTKTTFMVERLGSDAIAVMDPAHGWSVAMEFSAGAGTNPSDIAAVSTKRAYISRLGDPNLLIVNPAKGTQIDKIDLSSYADADHNPDAIWLYSLDGKLYVLLARLKNAQYPTDYSAVLVIDGPSGKITDEVRLSATNPFGKLRYNRQLDRLIIIESGKWGENDGGIELFDPATKTVSGLLITEKALGGDAVDAVIVSDTKGYAIVGYARNGKSETHLVSFNPASGKLLKELLVSDSWTYSSMELTPDRTELWVADRDRKTPGIRIFDTATDVQLTSKPIDTGLPPFMICFVP